jgi:hypothetical protein
MTTDKIYKIIEKEKIKAQINLLHSLDYYKMDNIYNSIMGKLVQLERQLKELENEN